MSYTLNDYDIQNIIDTAKHQRDPNSMMKALEMWEKHKAIQAAEQQLQLQYPPPAQPWPEPVPKLSISEDMARNKKTVQISVNEMVIKLLGGHDPNRDVQVHMEHYGYGSSHDPNDDPLLFIAVNICDIKTGNIITLRETYAKFPSPEFLTKLELLRVGKTDG